MLGAAPGARKAGRAKRHPRDANGAAAYSVGYSAPPGTGGEAAPAQGGRAGLLLTSRPPRPKHDVRSPQRSHSMPY